MSDEAIASSQRDEFARTEMEVLHYRLQLSERQIIALGERIAILERKVETGDDE